MRCSGGVSGDQWWSQRVGLHWGVLCSGATQIRSSPQHCCGFLLVY